MDKNRSGKYQKILFLIDEINFIFQTNQRRDQMKYFWWRLLDYATGALGGGVIVFFVSKFACQQCIGPYTPVLMLGIWIGFMLLCNFIFQKARPSSIKQDTV